MRSKLILLAFLILTITSCEKEPTSCFSASKTNVTVGEPVTFTSCSENANNYEWDFNDGVKVTGNPVTHAFSKKGEFKVKLKAYSKSGDKISEQIVTITVI